MRSPSSEPERVEPVSFFVEGKPQAWERAIPRRGGKGRFTAPKDRAWRTRVGWAGRQAMGPRSPLEIPVALHLVFVLPRRRGCRGYPVLVSEPDLSNLQKGVEDALNGIVYRDDRLIVCAWVEKRYPNWGEVGGKEGVSIYVEAAGSAN